MAKRSFSGTPITDSVKIDKLRLGDTLLEFSDGKWIGRIIYYLAEASIERSRNVQMSTIFALDNIETILDRFINPEAYRLQPLPLHPCEWDLPAGMQQQSCISALKKVTLSVEPNEEPTFDIGKPYRFLKQISQQDAVDIGLDHRTLRYAAQHLYPGANVIVRDRRGQMTGRVKAVGFGICGPIGICLHTAPEVGRDSKAQKVLSADFWTDISEADVIVQDKRRPGYTAMTFHHLRQLVVPTHA